MHSCSGFWISELLVSCTTLFPVKQDCLLTLTLSLDCDVSLFELALQLREKRLDIEEALVEEKKIVDNLKKEYDTISKKVWWSTYLSPNILSTHTPIS